MFATLFRVMLGLSVLLAALYASAASYYWLGWPDAVRIGLAIFITPVIAIAWFLPGDRGIWRRSVSIIALAVFFIAYAGKTPYPQTFVPLHAKVAGVAFDGSRVTITNFRDAVHPIGAPAEPRWITRSFDLADLVGAQFVLQPFGNSLATVHVMTSFEFADGDHLAVSFEARRTSWDKFDPLAGFFRHDQLYAVLGTERDLFWKRLAHVPPNDLYVFEITRSDAEIRAYLRRLLEFASSLQEQPQFYSTISESCFTTLLNLMPRLEKVVPWYDLRRWVPGASVGLFQELGLVDSSVPTEQLVIRQKLVNGVRPPWEFATSNEWSDHFRSKIGAP
ncbi:lipoprotein N-acyltransferase Lnb domain-containing protein [Roseibium alexandrii]|uniref:Lnb N-terminal periplasmic domain-containing protein n=1 Tax=Roseibium alexandrii (strain DSM 17067 / NCIMB 14079 / DFL-11) TaxID=244592 RepID=A0A5E8H6M6_ROSAD|nr:DUF4105 domain-containing protein [Roseibium alexandrii]EEE47644.2 hypothetical protein SADFL11_4933 [Roseibium alexandrii DFL-11]